MHAFCWQLAGVFLITAAGSMASAEEGPPGTSSLDTQIATLQQLVIKDEGPVTGEVIPPASRHVNVLMGNVEAKDFRNALTQAKLIAGADPSPAVKKAIDALIPALQAVEGAQSAEVKARLKTILDQATNAVLTMKNPGDFDALITSVSSDLDQARAGAYGNGWDRQYAYTQLEAASRYLKQWQSYLIDQKSGNTQAVANDLRNLAESTNSFAPIPRSELLERAQKVSPLFGGGMGVVPTPAVASPKIVLQSLDDLPAALNQIDQLRRTGGFSQQLNVLYNEMQILQNANRAYQEGNDSVALQQLVNNYSMMMAGGNEDEAPLAKELAGLKNTLLLQVVQALLALPSAPPPQKNQSAPDYLLALAATEEKAADWPALQQVLQVYQQVAGMMPEAWLQEDLSGLRAYLVGNKLEAAGQHLDAIRSYRQSLATLGKFFPADPPQARLEALQKKYPELYQQALQQPINRGP